MRRSSVDSKFEDKKLLPFLKIKYQPGTSQVAVYNEWRKKRYLENQRQTAQEVEH